MGKQEYANEPFMAGIDLLVDGGCAASMDMLPR